MTGTNLRRLEPKHFPGNDYGRTGRSDCHDGEGSTLSGIMLLIQVLHFPNTCFDSLLGNAPMNILSLTFDRRSYEIFRSLQWEEHPRWDGETFSLDAYGRLYITARVGGQRVPRYPVIQLETCPDLDKVRRIYQDRRSSGGRFKVDEGGARGVYNGRDLPYFVEFI